MGAIRHLGKASAMASRWRRRSMCLLIADRPAPAALCEVSGTGAFVETGARPALGAKVELHHPEAGAIAGTVSSVSNEGVGLTFAYGERSIAFALAAIAADMSRPEA